MQKTIKGGTITSRGVIPHKFVHWGQYLIEAPVAVVTRGRRTEAVGASDGKYVYVLPDGSRFEC